MDEGYLVLEQDDSQNAYYFAFTNSGAVYCGAANSDMELVSEWKLISVSEDAIETIH